MSHQLSTFFFFPKSLCTLCVSSAVQLFFVSFLWMPSFLSLFLPQSPGIFPSQLFLLSPPLPNIHRAWSSSRSWGLVPSLCLLAPPCLKRSLVGTPADKLPHPCNPRSTHSKPIPESRPLFLPLELKSTYTCRVVRLSESRRLESASYKPASGREAVRDFRDGVPGQWFRRKTWVLSRCNHTFHNPMDSLLAGVGHRWWRMEWVPLMRGARGGAPMARSISTLN